LIPWTISQQFQDADFASLSGARVVRIATHPEMTKMGYGGRAMDLLSKFYSGQLTSLSEVASAPLRSARGEEGDAAESAGGGLAEERISARKALPPLLVPVTQICLDATYDMYPPPHMTCISSSRWRGGCTGFYA
jgi:N-acetyltransferase 10